MVHGMPGPGGSLGQCAVCGDSFVRETLRSLMGFGDGSELVHTFRIDGITGDMCAHKLCLEKMEELASAGPFPWEKLPEGPLRKVFAKAAAESAPCS